MFALIVYIMSKPFNYSYWSMFPVNKVLKSQQLALFSLESLVQRLVQYFYFLLSGSLGSDEIYNHEN